MILDVYIVEGILVKSVQSKEIYGGGGGESTMAAILPSLMEVSYCTSGLFCN